MYVDNCPIVEVEWVTFWELLWGGFNLYRPNPPPLAYDTSMQTSFMIDATLSPPPGIRYQHSTSGFTCFTGEYFTRIRPPHPCKNLAVSSLAEIGWKNHRISHFSYSCHLQYNFTLKFMFLLELVLLMQYAFCEIFTCDMFMIIQIISIHLTLKCIQLLSSIL